MRGGVVCMNDSALYLIREHGGKTMTVLPGAGFDTLTSDTACTYLLDSDHRILAVVLETAADEPIDDVCDFFVQQVYLATKPSATMRSWGIEKCYGGVLVVRLALDDVPDWQKSVIESRMSEAMTIVATHRSTWRVDDDEDA